MPAATTTQVTASIRVVGALIPADMITRIMAGKDVSSSMPADYHVVGVRSVKDAAERHWDYLKGAWRVLRDAMGQGSDPRGLAIENWLLPLFDEHGYGRLTRLHAGITADDGTKIFPVSHAWQHLPIHLVPWDQDLDMRPADGGLPPQSMVQECLNRTAGHLWGIVSNGSVLRLLRDNTSLTGAAYLEVDLAAMFGGELFEDFVLLYRLLHVSRFEVADGAPVSSCRMERWRAEAIEAGTRALDQLRDGVQAAVAHLGTGFLRHPANARLREDQDAELFKRALLRLVYRLLFWFVAEDRDVLIIPGAAEDTRSRYQKYFSSRRLRAIALRRVGTSHGDLWEAVRLVLRGLGDENGLPQLGLPGLGGIYDDAGTDQILHGLELSNEHLLAAIRSLARVHDASIKRYRPVDYRNLGSEELGSIYESLLELVPKWSKEERRFLLDVMPGNERKTTGSYYTPTSLIDCLLDTALDPVLDDAQKRAEAAATVAGTDPSTAIADALLSITVCDPACGSGHFLVAAARRIAKRLAAVREHNPEPVLGTLRTALRDVVSRCVYGVDINPMAVELAKVSLWLEALEPGKPLGFLDARIKSGNALVGATPALMANGIPDEAFKPIEGDDRRWAASLRRASSNDNPGQDELFGDQFIFSQSNEMLAAKLARIAYAPDGSLHDVHLKAVAYRDWEESPEYRHARQVADAWCAAFVWHKTKQAPPAIVNRVFRALREQGSTAIPPATRTEIERLSAEFGFFHWHLEFPDVFSVPNGADPAVDPATGWFGGFTCLLGNPPWEHVELKEQEFFSARDEKIAVSTGAARKRRIEELPRSNPDLADEYQVAKRRIDGMRHFASESALYPLCGRGRIKTDTIFAEQGRRLIEPRGRFGMIIPTGIATDATTQYFFKDLVQHASLAALYDFENAKPIFQNVHRSYKFSLLTLAGKAAGESRADFAFFLHDVSELDDSSRRFVLTPSEISLLNPNTGTCPVFRTRRDAEITLGVYRRLPVLVKEDDPNGNPWGVSLMQGMFNMTSDSHLFLTREELEEEGWRLTGNIFIKGSDRMLPLYESKMLHLYDHRWATYERDGSVQDISAVEKQNPSTTVMPRYWVKSTAVSKELAQKNWHHRWMIGFRKICRSTDERTVIGFYFPAGGLGDSGNIVIPADGLHARILYACMSSLPLDYILRQKLGGTNLNFFQFEQLPFVKAEEPETVDSFISPRMLELIYTAYDMEPFAQDLGDNGSPFRWDEERRFMMKAELDAFFFQLYGIGPDDVDHIMETFPIVKKKDIAKYGSYRTKETILAFCDRMTSAATAGIPYETTITPPPGRGSRYPSGE